MPQRIQRKRVKGFRLKDASTNPLGVVCVDRSTDWGNPYKIGERYRNPFDREQWLTVTGDNCLQLFELYAEGMLAMQSDWLEPLRGRDLACFCPPDAPCHADVLLKLANAPRAGNQSS